MFKSKKDSKNWIKKSEDDFTINLRDILMANFDGLAQIDLRLQKQGLSCTKLLNKNSVNSIEVIVEPDKLYKYQKIDNRNVILLPSKMA